METVSLGHGYICCVIIISVANGIGVVEMEFSLSLMLWLYMLLTTWYRSLMHLAWYSTSLWEIIL